MHLLRRTVRVNILPPGSPAGAKNPYAGFPTMTAMGAFYAFEVCVRGEPDAHTGYLRDIKHVDRCVRETLVPAVTAAFGLADTNLPTLLFGVLPALDRALGGGLVSVRWHLSPYYSLEVTMASASPARVLIRQKFDFAAAHRLHVPTLSDEANRATFGKCNNLNGHGHNYEFEPCVSVPMDAHATGFGVATLERLADQVLIERFDHKHLNEDTPEFDPRRGGVNPSVENIAAVFYNLLAPHIAHAGAHLEHMTVWETDRTSATYPA